MSPVTSIDYFAVTGRVSCIIDGQYGSTGKGALAAYLATRERNGFDFALTNAAPNAGHTSIHNGKKAVTYHLPTIPLHQPDCMIGLTSGCAIDVDLLFRECETLGVSMDGIMIHPMAAIIEQEDKDAEGDPTSGPAGIASTQKGVGSAFARRLLRKARVAKDEPRLAEFVHRWHDVDLQSELVRGARCSMEIPQGRDLSLTGEFYPHCTSRNVNIAQALSDLHLHPMFLGRTAMSVRTFPIRVGNLNGKTSGGCWPDQDETTWEDIGQTPEVTTVTGRVRRVFTWSNMQFARSAAELRPDLVWLSFCDYLKPAEVCQIIEDMAGTLRRLEIKPNILCSSGPTTDDVCSIDRFYEEVE